MDVPTGPAVPDAIGIKTRDRRRSEASVAAMVRCGEEPE
jgi:hypothetical protein